MQVIWHYMIEVCIEDARPYACHGAAKIAGISQMSNIEHVTKSHGIWSCTDSRLERNVMVTDLKLSLYIAFLSQMTHKGFGVGYAPALEHVHKLSFVPWYKSECLRHQRKPLLRKGQLAGSVFWESSAHRQCQVDPCFWSHVTSHVSMTEIDVSN